MKYRIHSYPIVRVSINVEADNPQQAMDKALASLDFNDVFNKEEAEAQEHLVVCFADEMSGYGCVDEDDCEDGIIEHSVEQNYRGSSSIAINENKIRSGTEKKKSLENLIIESTESNDIKVGIVSLSESPFNEFINKLKDLGYKVKREGNIFKL